MNGVSAHEKRKGFLACAQEAFETTCRRWALSGPAVRRSTSEPRHRSAWGLLPRPLCWCRVEARELLLRLRPSVPGHPETHSRSRLVKGSSRCGRDPSWHVRAAGLAGLPPVPAPTTGTPQHWVVPRALVRALVHPQHRRPNTGCSSAHSTARSCTHNTDAPTPGAPARTPPHVDPPTTPTPRQRVLQRAAGVAAAQTQAGARMNDSPSTRTLSSPSEASRSPTRVASAWTCSTSRPARSLSRMPSTP